MISVGVSVSDFPSNHELFNFIQQCFLPKSLTHMHILDLVFILGLTIASSDVDGLGVSQHQSTKLSILLQSIPIPHQLLVSCAHSKTAFTINVYSVCIASCVQQY